MRLYVAVTNNDWFALHASKNQVDEVNFWRPSAGTNFKVLQPGELLLFKLHAPENFLVGGGFFTRFLNLPLRLAWDAFGEANGVRSLEEMRNRIATYRRSSTGPSENPEIGCILLAEPFFWDPSAWIPIPSDFKLSTVQGKGYDSESAIGRQIWLAVADRLQASPYNRAEEATATAVAIASNGFGKPQIIHPRLGQGSFRVLVTDAYGRRCAMTAERTLPVLEAAHIKPYPVVERHEVANGLLLRSDLHKLFDQGYMTIDPNDRRIVVSTRIKEEFENGRDYYKLHGQLLREPSFEWARPLQENLEYHSAVVFK